jgi:hypothetical protein
MASGSRGKGRAAVAGLLLAFLLPQVPLPAVGQTTRDGGSQGGSPLIGKPDDTLVPAEKMPGTTEEHGGSSSPSGNLSRQLNRSGGIITPPKANSLDPGMQAPPPSPGVQSTPIIPPPGTPGGNPQVQPK